MKRDLELIVLSDVHLGTVGCHARELVEYLEEVNPKTVVLNGDFIDAWNFRKYYWPDSHMKVVKTIISMLAEGTQIIYLTGNHDEVLRKVSGLELGQFRLKDSLDLELGGDKVWIFHGDIFDITMKHSKWIAKLGGQGYDLLILFNKLVNTILRLFGQPKISLSKRVKDSVKKAVNFVDDYEMTAMDLAIDEGYDIVICGHIHKPKIRTYNNQQGQVRYMNSGDWVENLTALEYDGTSWTLYQHPNVVGKRIEQTTVEPPKAASLTESTS